MEILITIAFVVVMVFMIINTLHSKKSIECLDRAWEHRKRIAQIANEIENDVNAPKHVKLFIGCLADRVFDEKYMKDLLLNAVGSQRSSKNPKSMRRYMESEFGKEYGDLLNEALKNFIHIILKSNIKLPKETNPLLENTRKLIKSLSGTLHDQTNDCIDINSRHAA